MRKSKKISIISQHLFYKCYIIWSDLAKKQNTYFDENRDFTTKCFIVKSTDHKTVR